MSKSTKRKCPGCGEDKVFRSDQTYCSRKCVRPKNGQELKETNEIAGDRWTVVLPKTRIHTLEQLVEFCQIDLSVWEVERFVANKWEVVLTPPATTVEVMTEDGRKIPMWVRDEKTPLTEPLYQIKAFLKKKTNIVFAKQEIAALKELAKAAFTPKFARKPSTVKGGMAEINLTDQHFGKMAWGLETRGPNYDMKIATKMFDRALDTILIRLPYETFEEIWFVVGNDLFNADDVQGRTTAGTFVETDARHEKTYVTVRTLIVQAIQKLRERATKVKVIVVPGNHDHHTTWHLGDSLELFFSNYDDVEVDNRPGPRKYHQYGQTLIGYTHGDKGKNSNLPLLMATEARDVFGKTKFHEWHTGHIHTLRVDERNGIRVRILSALCPADAWHAEQGYVGNLRSSEAFVWDREEGLIGTVIYTDDDSLIESASEIN